MIDGKGAPEGIASQEAIGALHSTAYTEKFGLKKAGPEDFVVPPLEALWRADDVSAFPDDRRVEWQWTLMVILPDHVFDEDLRMALVEPDKKRKLTDVRWRMRTEVLEEGQALYCPYVWPDDSLGGAIAGMWAVAESKG